MPQNLPLPHFVVAAATFVSSWGNVLVAGQKRFGYDEINADGRNEYFTLRCDNCGMAERERGEERDRERGREREGKRLGQTEGAKCFGESRDPLVVVHTIFGLALFVSILFFSYLPSPPCFFFLSPSAYVLGIAFRFDVLPEN